MLDLALLGHAGQPECRLCANGADDLETVRVAFEAACQCAEGDFRTYRWQLAFTD